MENHTRVLAIRHGVLSAKKGTQCLLCHGSSQYRGSIGSCPMAWLYWLHHAYNLSRVIPTIYGAWSLRIPMELGVLVLYPPGSFCIRIMASAVDPAPGTIPGLPTPFPVHALGHTGDVTGATHRALLDKGLSQPMFLALLHTVVQHTVWFTRRDWLTSLPVLPQQVIENRRGNGHQPLVRQLDSCVSLNRFCHMCTVPIC